MWIPLTREEIVKLIESYAQKGVSAADIGRILRDMHGIPSVKAAVGKRIDAIIRERGLAKDFPSDLLALIRKAVRVRSHLAAHRGDEYAKLRLQRIESKIRRLVKYYARTGRIPKQWIYEPERAALLVR